MRVLIVSQYFWPERFVINDMVRRLISADADVDVLTGQPNYPSGKIEEPYRWWKPNSEEYRGAAVFRVPLVPRGLSSRVRLVANYVSFVVSGSIIGPFLLRGRSQDVVLAYLPSPILAAIPALLIGRIKGVEVLLWVQDLWPGSMEIYSRKGGRWLNKLLGYLVRWIYRRADRILISSEAFREPVSELLEEADAQQKIRYLANPFDPETEVTTDLQLPNIESEFSILVAGNLGRAQALETILSAAELLRGDERIGFYLVGAGSMLGYVQDRIRHAGLTNVTLCGQYPNAAMPDILSRGSALLIALSSEEVLTRTVPSRLQAYLAAGKPILGAVNGETARLISESGAGWCCEAENSPALAQLIRKMLLADELERAEMGRLGKAYFERFFDPEDLMRQLIDQFDELAQPG